MANKKKKACNQHQFVEMNAGRDAESSFFKDVMCAHCGHRRRMHDDGRIVEK